MDRRRAGTDTPGRAYQRSGRGRDVVGAGCAVESGGCVAFPSSCCCSRSPPAPAARPPGTDASPGRRGCRAGRPPTASAGCSSRPSSRRRCAQVYRARDARTWNRRRRRAAAGTLGRRARRRRDGDQQRGLPGRARARLGAGFSPESWNAWVKRREATPLPGAAEFLARVRALGGRIAIVTNRLQSECDDTAGGLRRAALVYDAMLCRPDGSPSDKNPRFEAVAGGRRRPPDRRRSRSWRSSATTSSTSRR